MGWLEQQVRKAAVQQLLLVAAVVAGVVAEIGMNLRDLQNYVAGPYVMSAAELVKVTNPDTSER